MLFKQQPITGEMTKDEDFKLLKIQTCVLKVNIHCHGCKLKVKKLLQRIEGVYQVNIDGDEQKVTVSGSVDSATLIKKLGRAGKHAQLWSLKPNINQHQNQNQKTNNCNKAATQNKGIIKGLEAFKNQQHKLPAFSLEEDDDYFDDDDDYDEEEDEEDELSFMRPISQVGLLKQQMQIDANNDKKKSIGGANNNNDNNINNKIMKNNINIVNGNIVEKKGNPNQNVGLKMNPEKAMLTGLKMNNNPQLGVGSEIGRLMNLAGFHGNNNVGNSCATTALSNPNGYQQIPSSMIMNMNHGTQNHYPAPSTAAVMMNMQNRNLMMQNQQQQEAQMMYHRSAMIPPNTGYYYNNPSPAPAPAPYPPYYSDQQLQTLNFNGDSSSAPETHMFNDENTTSCSIM